MNEPGTPISKLLNGDGPWPTYILKWGENMPPDILRALKEDGEAALIVKDGEVFSMIVYNEFVGMREMSVSTMREYNQKGCYVPTESES